jgi:hypothetical protein
LCCLFVDDIFDSIYFLKCLGDGFKEESLKYLPSPSENKENTNISTDEASTKKSEEHTYDLSRSSTAASF